MTNVVKRQHGEPFAKQILNQVAVQAEMVVITMTHQDRGVACCWREALHKHPFCAVLAGHLHQAGSMGHLGKRQAVKVAVALQLCRQAPIQQLV